jgi:signal transduction histidine kinase
MLRAGRFAALSRLCRDIHASGAHLLSLINDLLDVAKIEAGRMDIAPHPLDPARVFDIALKLISTKAREKDQTLAISVEPGARRLYADERAVKQILINLVSNAVKFTPLGGRIEVVGGRASNGDFQIMVRDNGPGIRATRWIDLQALHQVDNRFDRQAGGTGLGLALVRGWRSCMAAAPGWKANSAAAARCSCPAGQAAGQRARRRRVKKKGAASTAPFVLRRT